MNQYRIEVKETITKIANVRAVSPARADASLREWLAGGAVEDLDYAEAGPQTQLGEPVESDPALFVAHVVDSDEYDTDGSPLLPGRALRPEFWMPIDGHYWAMDGHVALREGEVPPGGRTGAWRMLAEVPEAPAKIAEWIARPARALHFGGGDYYEPFKDAHHVESARHDGDEIVALNGLLWAPWGQCDWSGNGALDPCVARRNGEAVAVVMPMRGVRTPRVMLKEWAKTGDPAEAQRLLARLSDGWPMTVDAHDLAWLVRKAIEVRP